METGKSIVIIQEKESIVTRGIVKKLEEMKYEVHVTSTGYEDVCLSIELAPLFMLYLSPNILGNIDEISKLIANINILRENERNMLFIGEKNSYEEILKMVPVIGGYTWLDRPLEMNDLMLALIDTERRAKEEADAAKAANALALAKMANEQVKAMNIAAPEKKRILIVDDDPSYASMVKEWLKDDYKVDIVTAGMQAIAFLLKKNVDLVLLDYEMPIVDGPKVLEMLRSEPQVANVPVIFLTGIGEAESVKRVMSLKPRGYILKSTPKEELMDYIKNHI